MGNFKAAALAVAAILGVSSLASQHHGPSPDLPDFRQPNDGGKLKISQKCQIQMNKLNMIVIFLPIPTWLCTIRC
jgi:hypothetical protein